MAQLTGQKNQDGLYIWQNDIRMTFEDRLMTILLREGPEDEDEEDEEIDF